MEYDFIALNDAQAEQSYARFDRRYQAQPSRYVLRLGADHLALQHFLMDEFERTAQSYQPLVQALESLGRFDDYSWQGKEYSLVVERQEVQIRHHRLGLDTELDEPELFEDLNPLFCECGLEDLVHLIKEWQRFLTK